MPVQRPDGELTSSSAYYLLCPSFISKTSPVFLIAPKRKSCLAMDPISVAASVLTVLGAAGTAGRALEHISQLRHASEHLIGLVNEVDQRKVHCKQSLIAVDRSRTCA